jgi:hypothetical protein
VLEVGSFRLVHFLAKERSRERNERMAKVRGSMGERIRRWHHASVSSEDLLADIRDLRESVEEPRERSDGVLKLENQQVHSLAEAAKLCTGGLSA